MLNAYLRMYDLLGNTMRLSVKLIKRHLLTSVIRLNEISIIEKLTTMPVPDRSSHRRYSVKKGVLKNFANITGKHLCWSLCCLRPATLLKRDSKTGVFLQHLQNF